MRLAIVTVTTLLLSVVATVAPPTANALSPEEISCQATILGAAQDFVSDKLQAIVDCNDKGDKCNTEKRDRQIGKAAGRLTRKISHGCDNVTLENLGFPGPCPPGGGAFTPNDLSSCMTDELETFVDAAIALTYPSGSPPPSFSGAEKTCQNTIGGEGRLFVNRKLRARASCLSQQVKGKISSSVDCLAAVPPGTGDRDTDKLIKKAIRSLADKLRRGCHKADLTSIGFPGSCVDSTGGDFTSDDLDACLEAALETAADQIAALLVPLLSPQPTPTTTPGVVATETTTPGVAETPTPSAGTPGGGTPTPTETATGAPGATPTETATAAPGATPTETATGAPGATPTPTGGPVETPTGAAETPTEVPTPEPSSTPGAGGTCPTTIEFTGTSTDGVLDTGWTGNGHDATVISDGKVTVTVTGCTNASPPCDVCSYTGPIANTTGVKNQRCQGGTNDTFPCTVGSECPSGNCKFFFGSFLPLAAGGVSTCVENTFAGGISGTANVDTSGVGAGTSVGSASVTSRVYNGITLSVPCPQCLGDGPTPNDGLKDGSCSGGAHPGAKCDVSGTSPNAAFGATSLDCPPLGGALIATLPINLDNTTGTKTRTLGAANPTCTATGWTTNKCQCDTCDNASATPCSSNADCNGGTGICGGLRCLSGPNAGAPCPAAGSSSVCPATGGGSNAACGRKGTATAANQCDAGTGDCVADPGTPGPNDRICHTGPNENFCGPTETFRGCSADSDCGFAGDTCSVSRFRDCFDNGVVGETVSATGNAVPPVSHQSDPTLAAMFCIGPTTSASVNNAAGLPGLGRLELTGHAVDNGTT